MVAGWAAENATATRRTSGRTSVDVALQAATCCAVRFSGPSPAAFFDEAVDVLFEFAEFVFLAEHGGSAAGSGGVELGFADHGGLVDPVAGDRLGEYIEGGLVVFDDDIGVVAVSSSGHGGVDARLSVGVSIRRRAVSTVRPWVAWLVWA